VRDESMRAGRQVVSVPDGVLGSLLSEV